MSYTELYLLVGKIAEFENSEKWAAHCDRMNDMFMTQFIERKEDPSRMKKEKKKQKSKDCKANAAEKAKFCGAMKRGPLFFQIVTFQSRYSKFGPRCAMGTWL